MTCNSRWSSDGKRRSDVTCVLEQDHDGDCVEADRGFTDGVVKRRVAPDVFTEGHPVDDSDDLQRILALPRRPVLDLESARAEALVEHVTAKYARIRDDDDPCDCRVIDPDRKRCITRLLPIQAWTLYEIALANGCLACVPTGAGKTIIWLLALLALNKEDSSSGEHVVLGPCQLGLLLVPPSLVDQLITDYRLLANHFIVPSLVVHGAKDQPQRTYRKPGMPTLHVLAYSRLSLPESSAWIDQFSFDAIIADECDRLKEVNGSGSGRLIRAFGKNGDMRFCGGTGTITGVSLSEFSHLAALALREFSPMPLDPDVVEDWGRCLDAVDDPCSPGALGALCPDEKPTPSAALRGFHRRFSETLGVITSTESKVVIEGTDTEVQLVIKERLAPEIPQDVLDALGSVRAFVRPDGEELLTALEVTKCAIEVAGGMYYRWRFDPIKGVPQKEVDIVEWKIARKLWFKEMRTKLFKRTEWLDSPNLCETAARRAWGDLPKDPKRPEWKAEHWPRYRDVKGKVKPTSEAVRINDYLARDAAEWASENRGIVWYSMVEFGEWVAELSGLPLHTGGPKAGLLIKAQGRETSIIASVNSHGRGRDGLQRKWNDQLLTNVFASATRFQQLLARQHRRGQDQEVVTTELYAHTRELRRQIKQALQRSRYVKGATGETQKLLVGWQGLQDGEDFGPEDEDA